MEKRELEQKVEELEKRAQELKEQAEARKADEARKNAFYGNNHMNNENQNTEWRSVAEAMKEKRTVQIQGTGAINQINGIWDLIKQKNVLLDRVSYFRGPNQKTAIALLAAHPAKPSKTSTANNAAHNKNYVTDNSQLLGVKEVTPYAWTSIIPVDYDTILYSFSDIETRLPALLADAFRDAMCDGMFTGDGSNGTIKGIFADGSVLSDGSSDYKPLVNHLIKTEAATGVSFKDLLDLALAVKDMDVANPVIVMEPAIYSVLAATSTQDYNFIKESLVRDKSVEGIPVILTGKAPSFVDAEAGDIVVWAGDLKNYGFAVADELTIETVKQVGDSNTYFQGIMSFTGDVIQPKNCFGLKKASV